MTEQELHRLGRRDLLKLLLVESREVETTYQKLTEVQKNLEEAEAGKRELKQKLEDRETQIRNLNEDILSLKEQIEQTKQNRTIELEKAGTIADAALKLSGIFRSAQDAADLYMENIKQREAQSQQITAEGKMEAQRLVEQSKERCEAMEAETALHCNDLERTTQEKCDQMLAEAKQEANKVWESLTKKMEQLHSQISNPAEIREPIPDSPETPEYGE